jgi:trans-aconitate methyltransferase
LDVCCGTGDAGRVIHSGFPHAQVDFVDRDLFFVSLCGAVNHRDGIRGRTLVRDLLQPDWRHDLTSNYDVVVAVNAMHWFSVVRAAELFGDLFQSLRSGGALSIALGSCHSEVGQGLVTLTSNARSVAQTVPDAHARFYSRMALLEFKPVVRIVEGDFDVLQRDGL